MQIKFLLSLFGGFINRIRGGWFELGALNKPINHILFGLTFGFQLPMTPKILYQMICIGVGMWAATCFGWGSYIAGIIDNKNHKRGDSKILDWLFLRSDNNLIWRNTFALNIRGAVFGFFIALGFVAGEYFGYPHVNYPQIIVLAGFMMGFIYKLSCDISEHFGDRSDGWQVGEFLFGTYLCSICYLVL